MTDMTRCLWTGALFEPVNTGGNEKVFVSSAARAEAHKAARLYTEHLIERGFMSWESLRQWFDARQLGEPSLPRPRRSRPEQMIMPLDLPAL